MSGRWVAQELPYKASTACTSASQSRLQFCKTFISSGYESQAWPRKKYSQPLPSTPTFLGARCMTAILHTQPRNDTNPSEGRLLESSPVFSSPICGRQQGEINSMIGGVKALKDAVRLFPIPSWDSRAQAAGADTKQNLSCLF